LQQFAIAAIHTSGIGKTIVNSQKAVSVEPKNDQADSENQTIATITARMAELKSIILDGSENWIGKI
jgi:hypothetical protein